MKKDFSRPVLTLGGAPAEDAGKTLTVGAACVNALLGPDDSATGEEKARRYQLALRIHAGGEVEVKSDELALLKTLVGRAYLPLVVGQVYAFLDE